MVAIDYSLQTLVGNNFNNLILNGSTFFKSTLDGVLMNQTRLRGTNFQEASLLNVTATGAIFAAGGSFGAADFFKATFSNTNLSGANLRGVNLTEANASFSNFSNANLTNATLQLATFQDVRTSRVANLTNAQLQQAVSPRCKLSRVQT
ncbi:MAG: pentapeptide repeat-containing protein [Leptolyngbyaceae cyanobacterium SM1_4_3]|nr:pentapeptide repeat-containing protein [Leptolyngbyaceae cyanobacterium SM1_4_3]